ncbi:hypothetical protein BH09PLA1_BH09PLA1_24810 [soil metagenome]
MSDTKRKAAPVESSPALLAYLDELVEHLWRLIPGAIRGSDADAIHDARVATRRLKAALDLLESAIDHRRLRPFARTLRKLRKRLGPLRDLDVMGDHLRELKKEADEERLIAITWLEVRIDELRKLAVNEARDTAPPGKMLAKLGTWWGVRDDISEAAAVTDSLLADSLSRQIATFAKESNRLVAPMSSDAADAVVDRVDPHAIRIAGKSLRYTLEMARVQGFAFSGDVMKSFKRMQDSLGLWHDFIVLTERMLSISGDEQLAHHDAPTQRAILGLSQVTLRSAEEQLDKFAALWIEKGVAINEAIVRASAGASAGPSTDPDSSSEIVSDAPPAINESQTDRDPSDSEGTADREEISPDAPEAA